MFGLSSEDPRSRPLCPLTDRVRCGLWSEARNETRTRDPFLTIPGMSRGGVRGWASLLDASPAAKPNAGAIASGPSHGARSQFANGMYVLSTSLADDPPGGVTVTPMRALVAAIRRVTRLAVIFSI
jgi:hypothetical protein